MRRFKVTALVHATIDVQVEAETAAEAEQAVQSMDALRILAGESGAVPHEAWIEETSAQ